MNTFADIFNVTAPIHYQDSSQTNFYECLFWSYWLAEKRVIA